MRYKVKQVLKRTGEVKESQVFGAGSEGSRLGHAYSFAADAMPLSKCVTLLRDDEGTYHPSNSGKFFLHQIFK